MRRRMMASIGGVKLPYKRRLAYLESTGTQYIDTKYNPMPGVSIIKMRCQFVSHENVFQDSGVYEGTYAVDVGISATSGLFFCRVFMSGNASDTRSDFLWHDFVLDGKNGLLKIDESLRTVSKKSGSRFNRSFLLFARHGQNSASGVVVVESHAKKRISFCEFSENGVVVKRLIPVMSYEGKPEMFDEVTQTFAERHGNFLYGELE